MEADDHFVGDLGGGGSDGVGDDGAGEVDDFEPGLPGAFAPVDVFTVHEEVVIEHADLVDDFFADKHGGSADPIDLGRVGAVEVGHEVVAGEFVVGEEASEEGVSEGGGDGVGEASAGVLEGAVGVEEFGADDAVFGVGRHEFDQGFDGSGVDDGVGIEKGDVAALAFLDGEVMAAGESEVDDLAEEAEFGEFFFDHVGGAVVGGVIDDDDFEICFVFGIAKRLETGSKIFDGVPATDGDAKVEIRHGIRGPVGRPQYNWQGQPTEGLTVEGL